jgi:magnesium chelatase family protein
VGGSQSRTGAASLIKLKLCKLLILHEVGFRLTLAAYSWQGHPSGKCHCTNDGVARYQDRISGPLLDRIDMQIEVAAMAPEAMGALAEGEATETIAARVGHAYGRQLARQGKSNQRLTTREIDRHCRLDAAGEKLLRASMQHMNWSARAYHRVLKVARTIADLAGSPRVLFEHVSEAVQCRRGLRER